MALSLGEIVGALRADGYEAELHGSADRSILSLRPLESATADDLSFLANPKYATKLAQSQAGCVILAPGALERALERPGAAAIATADPYRAFAWLTRYWRRQHGRTRPGGVHPSAVVSPEAQVHPTARIGALAVVEAGAVIGPDTELRPHVFVGEDCRIGARCLLHPGVVVGADGFGFAPHAGAWEKIEQLGAVRIGDDVEIGANTCIDRGALDDTVIEHGVKLDNLIQIGHNVRVGAHTAMAGCVGVAGSAVIGAHCSLGGGAIVLGHLHIADHVTVSAASVVFSSIDQPGTYTGFFPIDEHARWEKNAVGVKQLQLLRRRLAALERSLAR